MRFYSWPYLFLLLPILGYFIWQFFYRKNYKYHSTIKYPDINKFSDIKIRSFKVLARKYLFVLKLAALLFLIIAIARLQSGQRAKDVETQGIDIMLALDTSGSMTAEDFKPANRLNVAKNVMANFIKGRKTDRIGLIVFAGESYTQCPLTLDYRIILEQIKKINFGAIDDGTAIGLAIANCVNRLRYSKAKSKVIILLTDGENNVHVIDPVDAAKAAEAFNIRIYTIGAGKLGGAPIPYHHPVLGKQYHRNPDGTLYLTKLDEGTLRQIADITGGKYFRATDSNALLKVYKKINKLEKTKIKTRQYLQYTENYIPFLLIGSLLLLGFLLVDNLILIKVP